MPTIAHDHLENWTCTVLEAAGATSGIARDGASSLVRADLRGHTSHGVRLLPAYLDRIDDGDGAAEEPRIDPTARPSVAARDGPRVLLDGDDAFGRIVGLEATQTAIRTAAEHGIAIVGVRESNHLGRMGEWVELATDHGLLSLSLVKAGASMVAPAGSADRTLSTNPITAGVSTYDALEFPIVLDMATSVVAGGKALERERTGTALPDRWVVDDDGDWVTDPEAFLAGEGALLPLGGATAGHKGFGLGVTAELFGALLGNTAVAGEHDPMPFLNAVSMFVVDPTWFTAEAQIAERIATFADHVRSADSVTGLSPGRDDEGRVLLPGEAEHRAEVSNRQSGIDLPEETVADLNAAVAHLGVEQL